MAQHPLVSQFPPRYRTVPAMLARQAERFGDRPLVSAGGRTWSFAQTRDEAACFAATLRAHGVAQGDRVALICSNRLDFLQVFLGCAWIGAVCVPINVASRGAQLQHILSNSAARLLILEHGFAANLDAFARAEHDERALGSLDFQSSITLLKVQASELAVETVMHAMRTAGLSGYRNDGEFTMGRHLRDVLSSPIMINNDRILANAATSTLMSGVPTSLRD